MSSERAATISGLSEREAAERVLRYGKNEFNHKRRVHPVLLFLQEFTSPLLLILIAVSVVSFFLGERTNAVIILAMALISAVMDFFNTYRSDQAVERLALRVRSVSRVIRDGEEREIPSELIVPGDIVKLSAGSIVPADGTVLDARDFFVNQSALTGESFPVEKRSGEKDGAFDLAFDNEWSVFSGTSVVSGFATVRIERTGKETAYGGIIGGVSRKTAENDFDRGIRDFSGFIVKLNFVLVVLILLANTLLGRDVIESVTFAVAIAIGLTPELLPVMLSVSLARGSVRMAKKSVIVKNLPSIENFGSMDILCTDKTGTLTEDRITLVRYLDPSGAESEEVFLASYINSAYQSGVKNPIDQAIRDYAAPDISRYEKIEEVPFDFVRRRNSIVVREDGRKILIAKGAPEAVLGISSSFFEGGTVRLMGESDRKRMMALYERLSGEGFRVLGVGKKEIVADDYVYDQSDERDLIFLGFLCFLDPPKQSAKRAVDGLESLGITIKILTGDNEILTGKICHDIGVDMDGATVLGKDIDALSDKRLGELAEKTTVFARVTPSQKERIIAALRGRGHVVGYLGDGINDVSALRIADVGVSVGNGVPAAKDTAGIILLEKNLDVLREGILEGRKTFQNTMKYLRMWLSSNFGNMFSMMGASLLLPFLPMRPEQVLLNNFLYDTAQIGLPGDRVDSEDVSRPTRWNIAGIKRYMFLFGPVSSIFDFVTFGTLILVFNLSEREFQTGWFLESLMTQILVIYVIRTRKFPFVGNRPAPFLLVSTLALIVIGWLIPFLPIGKLFSFEAVRPSILLAIIGITLSYLVLVEFLKRLYYRKPEIFIKRI